MITEEEEEEKKARRMAETNKTLQNNYKKTFIEPVEKAANKKYVGK